MQSVCVLEESFISCTVSAQNENKMGKCVLREMKAHKFDFGVIAAHILSLGHYHYISMKIRHTIFHWYTVHLHIYLTLFIKVI